jgi:sigma-B regulation protein RsbU (phosphoserine phosphatase)
VGGDFYDVFRLDESHVGFYVADAVGHGVPASLLTMFLKKAVRGKEISGQSYRLLRPGVVLERVNRDLIEQGLAESPFITMVYGLFNFHEAWLEFARAGHPHPLYLPADGAPERWQVPGTLLGVYAASFAAQTHRLGPGDKILVFTDGTENVSFAGHPAGAESLAACAALHRDLPAQEFVDQVARDLSHQAEPPDDVTLLALEVLE